MRLFVIAAFALLGAFLSVTGMPAVLDMIFESVRSSTTTSQVKEQTSAAVDIETFHFRRIVFGDPTKSAEERLKMARSAEDAVRSKELTFGQAIDRYQSEKYPTTVGFSEKKIRERPDLAPLLKLQPGQISDVFIDSELQLPVIFELQSIDQAGGNSAAVEDQTGYRGSQNPSVLVALALFGAVLGAVTGTLVWRGLGALATRWEGMDTGSKVTLFVGIFFGVVASLPFLFAFGSLGNVIAPLLTFGLTIGLSALTVYALRSMEDVLPWQTGNRKVRRTGVKVLDTNVLIDGRIYDLARTGFLEGELYVPRFVLLELQHIADSSDTLRRQRGRRGLDVLRHLQSDFPVEVGTHDKLAGDDREPVDSRLVRLAKALGADLVSNDYNLNRVASIQEVRVLNINDLALALRPTVLPGEKLELSMIREGNQAGQGVGYLDDGTMVVVEQGKRFIGELVTVSVTQVIQTERGKMMFAEMDEETPTNEPVRRKPGARHER
ncbi:MAG: TRAM domain-containing protein [Fimbriimonadaceae bacterium]|nr:TRAM domain-containing protein [Fimbriimonadaceae bacterium]QYK56936.1 MAG: TRAM domain-containing protein [Fimbriimonadaceae bacterium]